MKRVLFISRSTLSHNLLRSVLPLIKTKVALNYVESCDQVASLPQKGKEFHLALVDWNVLARFTDFEKNMEFLSSHKLLRSANRVLMHPRTTDIPRERLHALGFKAFYTKPFMTDELAQMIVKGTKTN